MKAIMVKKSESGYEIPGAAVAESWDDVRMSAFDVEFIESLAGWGEWTDAYRVSAADGAPDVFYFIADEEKIFRAVASGRIEPD